MDKWDLTKALSSDDRLKIEFAELARMSRLKNRKMGSNQVFPLGTNPDLFFQGSGMERINK